MYQASEQFNTVILGDDRTFRAKIKSGDTEITSGIISINQYAQSASDTIAVGGAMSAYVEIQMWKPDVQLEGNEVEVSIGLMLDGDLEYVPLGLYTVQKPEDDDGVIRFTGYDRMQSKMGEAYLSELDYPADGKDVLAEISSKTGVPIDTGSLPDGILINERVSCEESDVNEYGEPVVNVTYVKPFNGYTYRDALGYIAQLYGKFATVNRSGTVVFRWYEEVDYEINTDRYYDDLTCAEQIFSVGAISCVIGDQVLHSGTGSANIQTENPVMTQERLDAVYQQIKDMQFLPSSLSFYGDVRLDIGDIVTVNDKHGNIVKVPIMQIMQDFDGGVLSKVQSFGGTIAGDSNKGPTERKLDQIYTDLFLVKELVGNKANFKLAYDLSVSVSGHAEQLNVQTGRIDSLSDRTTELEFGAIGIKTTVSEIRTDLSGTQAKLTTVESQAIQAADHISWIVKSGTSATDFTLTDRTAELIAESLVIKDSTGASTIISGGKMDINQIFAQDITATGTIRGVNLVGATGSFSGSVSADTLTANSGGTIAGWNISSGGISKTTGTQCVYVLNGTDSYKHFLVVNELNSDGSWKSTPFEVRADGTIIAKKGKIGCFNLDSDSMYTTSDALVYTGSSGNIYLGSDGIGFGSSYLSSGGGAAFNGYDGTNSSIEGNTIQLWAKSDTSDNPAIELFGGGGDNSSSYITVQGRIGTGGEIRSSMTSGSCQFRAIRGNYSFMIRNDGNATYFLLTNSGDQYGIWNDLRPITINNSSGKVTIAGVVDFSSTSVYANTTISARPQSGGDPSYVIVTNTTANYYVNRIWCSATSTLSINGRWNSTSNSNKTIAVNSSDIRLKDNVVDSTVDALPVINRIKIRQFDWNDHPEHQRIGFVADELELIDSKFAIGGGYDADGVMNEKMVDTFYMLGYVVKGMQEICAVDAAQDIRLAELDAKWISHDAQIETLQMQLAGAMARIAEQDAEIEQLRNMITAA